MSVMHQCMAMGLRRVLHPSKIVVTDCKLEELAEHITHFSLAGIEAIREKIEDNAAKYTATRRQ